MTPTLTDLAAALRAARADVAEARSRIPRADPGAFGSGSPGQLGGLADQLHRLWSDALDGRRAEAGHLIGQLDANAGVVEQAAARYRAVEDGNQTRWAARP